MLLFFDGFDHYTTAAQIALKGWSGLANAAIVGSGRTGNCLRIQENNVGGYTGAAQYALPSSLSRVIFGTGMKITNNNDQTYFEVRESATVHLTLYRNPSSGLLEVYRGAVGGTLLCQSVTAVSKSAWFHVGLDCTIHDSTGEVKLYVNGVLEDTFNGDTRNAGTSGVVTNLYYRNNRSSGSSGDDMLDDFWVVDPASSPNDTFLGDCKVETLMPNGNGNSSVLVGSDGNSTDNYLLVDEATPNDDTDYVESSTVGDKDTYTYANIATIAGSVKAVQIIPYAKKTDAGARQIATVSRLSGTEVDSAAQTLSTSYAMFRILQETKPGGGAWAISDVDGAEFGVKIIA